MALTLVLELWPARSSEASTLMLYDLLDLLRPGNEGLRRWLLR